MLTHILIGIVLGLLLPPCLRTLAGWLLGGSDDRMRDSPERRAMWVAHERGTVTER
jgi:hypothetical protein